MIASRQLIKIALYIVIGAFLVTFSSDCSIQKPQMMLSVPTTEGESQAFPLMTEQQKYDVSPTENKKQDAFVFDTRNGSLHNRFAGPPGTVLQQEVIQDINYVFSQTEQGFLLGAQRVSDGQILWHTLLCPYPRFFQCGDNFGSLSRPNDWFSVTQNHTVYAFTILDGTYKINMIDGRSGTVFWSTSLMGAPINNQAQIYTDDKYVYIFYYPKDQKLTDQRRRLQLLDAVTGKSLKSFVLPGSPKQARILNGILYFDDQTPTSIYALRISDGKILWMHQYAASKAPLQWDIGSYLYLRFHTSIRAASLVDGHIVWASNIPSEEDHLKDQENFLSLEHFGVSHNILYDITANNGHTYLTLFRPVDGKVLWSTTLAYHPLPTEFPGTNPLSVEVLLITNQMLYIRLQGLPVQMFLNREIVYALNKENGKELGMTEK